MWRVTICVIKTLNQILNLVQIIAESGRREVSRWALAIGRCLSLLSVARVSLSKSYPTVNNKKSEYLKQVCFCMKTVHAVALKCSGWFRCHYVTSKAFIPPPGSE